MHWQARGHVTPDLAQDPSLGAGQGEAVRRQELTNQRRTVVGERTW